MTSAPHRMRPKSDLDLPRAYNDGVARLLKYRSRPDPFKEEIALDVLDRIWQSMTLDQRGLVERSLEHRYGTHWKVTLS